VTFHSALISDNIRSLLEVIDLAEEENLSCIVLSINFEKAFDTINWKLKKNIFPFLILVSNKICVSSAY
jgi:hypothetical protein